MHPRGKHLSRLPQVHRNIPTAKQLVAGVAAVEKAALESEVATHTPPFFAPDTADPSDVAVVVDGLHRFLTVSCRSRDVFLFRLVLFYRAIRKIQRCVRRWRKRVFLQKRMLIAAWGIEEGLRRREDASLKPNPIPPALIGKQVLAAPTDMFTKYFRGTVPVEYKSHIANNLHRTLRLEFRERYVQFQHENDALLKRHRQRQKATSTFATRVIPRRVASAQAPTMLAPANGKATPAAASPSAASTAPTVLAPTTHPPDAGLPSLPGCPTFNFIDRIAEANMFDLVKNAYYLYIYQIQCRLTAGGAVATQQQKDEMDLWLEASHRMPKKKFRLRHVTRVTGISIHLRQLQGLVALIPAMTPILINRSISDIASLQAVLAREATNKVKKRPPSVAPLGRPMSATGQRTVSVGSGQVPTRHDPEHLELRHTPSPALLTRTPPTQSPTPATRTPTPGQPLRVEVGAFLGMKGAHADPPPLAEALDAAQPRVIYYFQGRCEFGNCRCKMFSKDTHWSTGDPNMVCDKCHHSVRYHGRLSHKDIVKWNATLTLTAHKDVAAPPPGGSAMRPLSRDSSPSRQRPQSAAGTRHPHLSSPEHALVPRPTLPIHDTLSQLEEAAATREAAAKRHGSKFSHAPPSRPSRPASKAW